jgi:hypothetical protein
MISILDHVYIHLDLPFKGELDRVGKEIQKDLLNPLSITRELSRAIPGHFFDDGQSFLFGLE